MPSLQSSAAYRIAFTYAAAFAVAILALGVAVYFAADAQFRGQRDRAIASELADLAQERNVGEVIEEIREREAARSPGSFGYALFDRAGRRIGGSMKTGRPSLGFSMIVFDDPREGPDPARAKAVDLPGGERLVVAVDSEVIEAIDATILSLFGVAFVIVLLVGLAGALLLGRYLRHRLAAISGTANAIVAGDLDRRMPVGPDGDEFDGVAVALNAMLDRIAGLMDNLRQVSSDVAHDLRTPLLRLRAQLERVGEDDGATERAIAHGDEILKLFGSILRIAEVEGGGLERTFSVVDLSALVEQVAGDFQPALADGGRTLSWEVRPGIAVDGDRELLAQMLSNLLDNVRVHTPVGTKARISLEGDDVSVRLSVADDGPGVEDTDRERMFRRFFRSEASRTTRGNGLGLSLVAAVATAHRGEASVGAGRPGLRVTVVLPRHRT